jgi:transcriptional regulator with XRE-family HTH domain
MIEKIRSPQEIADEIGKRAARRRLALGLRQADLAERSGVSPATIARFERGGDTRLSHVVRLAIALDAEEGLARLFPAPDLRSLDDILAAEAAPKRARASTRRHAT